MYNSNIFEIEMTLVVCLMGFLPGALRFRS